MSENDHACRKHLPMPRRWRLGRVRACPCGRLYACQMWGILAPHPVWLPVYSDRLLTTTPTGQRGGA